MKRGAVLKVIGQALLARNTGGYSYNETEHADLVLKSLEDLDLIKPKHKKIITRTCMMGTPYEDTVNVDGWEIERD